jgi:glycosyltransferase involved in cell wall biosynthesis
MRVSVVIPHYNMADYLPRAVKSVHDQGDMVKELVVVDDGSDEEEWLRAMAACTKYEFETEAWYRYEENRGQAHALNDGLDSVLGHVEVMVDAIAFLDADDEWVPLKLREQCAVLEAEPDTDMVFGHARQILWSFGESSVLPIAENIQPAPLLSALLIRRESLQKVGLFEENLGAGMMIEWLDRAQARGLKYKTLPGVVYHRHVHGTNYGIVHRDRAREEYARAIRLIEERRKSD